MGEIKLISNNVKVFCGLLANSEDLFADVETKLEEKLQTTIDFESMVFPFEFTDYYNEEMGDAIFRKFISFELLVNPLYLVDLKHLSNYLELEFVNSDTGDRNVNIDPGYLNLSKIVLASTKDFRHRLYVDKGIYEEITLHYKKGEGYKPWEWTFPDYRAPISLDFFNTVRKIYTQQLASMQEKEQKQVQNV